MISVYKGSYIMNQEYQLKKLKEITGYDFRFVSDKDNEYGVKYYVMYNENTEENNDVFEKIVDKGLYCSYDDKNENNILVFENEYTRDRYFSIVNRGDKYNGEFEPLGQIHGHNVYLESLPGSVFGDPIVERNARAIVVVCVNNKRIPYYVSSGTAGKEKDGIKSKRWYPLVGIGKEWLNKMPDMNNNPYPELDEIANMLEKKFPAEKMRNAALLNDIEFFKTIYPNQELPKSDVVLPTASDALLGVANADFPEGVMNSASGYSMIDRKIYSRNKNIYLARIINQWRAKPSDYMLVSGGILMDSDTKSIEDFQKKISFPLMIDGDFVWFETNKHYPDLNAISQELKFNGINFNMFVTSDVEGKKRLGIYKSDLLEVLKNKKTAKFTEFNKATKKVEEIKLEPKKEIIKSKVFNFVQNIINTIQND